MKRYLVTLVYCEHPIIFRCLAACAADARDQAIDVYPNADITNSGRERRRYAR